MLSIISCLVPPPSSYYSWIISLWHQNALFFINQEIFCYSHKASNAIAFSPAQDMVQLLLKSSDLLTEQKARSQITSSPPKKSLLSIPNSQELAIIFFPLSATSITNIYIVPFLKIHMEENLTQMSHIQKAFELHKKVFFI